MLSRVCISINNRCNLKCKYCHFNEKQFNKTNMDVFIILDNIKKYIHDNNIQIFKIGFVGDGEPLLDFNLLKKYILYIKDEILSGIIKPYTITNGTILTEEMLLFFKEYNVNLGFSIDGPKNIHDKNRCNTFDKVMENINLYKKIFGTFPSFNVTVGKEILQNKDEVIDFFKQFDNKITFSRMIGLYQISLNEYYDFINFASKFLNIRKGGYDCTMYGGMCAAGIDNLFYANNFIYYCGNCIDKQPIAPSNTPLEKIKMKEYNFDRTKCFKEEFL